MKLTNRWPQAEQGILALLYVADLDLTAHHHRIVSGVGISASDIRVNSNWSLLRRVQPEYHKCIDGRALRAVLLSRQANNSGSTRARSVRSSDSIGCEKLLAGVE